MVMVCVLLSVNMWCILVRCVVISIVGLVLLLLCGGVYSIILWYLVNCVGIFSISVVDGNGVLLVGMYRLIWLIGCIMCL